MKKVDQVIIQRVENGFTINVTRIPDNNEDVFTSPTEIYIAEKVSTVADKIVDLYMQA